MLLPSLNAWHAVHEDMLRAYCYKGSIRQDNKKAYVSRTMHIKAEATHLEAKSLKYTCKLGKFYSAIDGTV